MYDEEKAIPLLPVVSPSPPLSTNFTDIPNYWIEEKMSTTPTTLPTSPVPASPNPPSWTPPAIGERSQEAQTRMLLAAQAADHAARQRNYAIMIHIIWAIAVIHMFRHAGPLIRTIIIFVFKQVIAAIGLRVTPSLDNTESHQTSG